MENHSLIEMEYKQRIKAQIVKNIEQGIDEWFEIVCTLGFETEDFDKWCNTLSDEVAVTLSECKAIVARKQRELLDKIEMLLEKSQELCDQLGIKLPQFTSINKGLYKDEAYLIEHIKVWQDQVNLRMIEINDLKQQRDDLCKQLSVVPFEIKEKPLPNQDDMLLYQNKIEELEAMKNIRIIDQQQVCDKIALIAQEIGYKPRLDFEKKIINRQFMSEIDVTEETMLRTTAFYRDLVDLRDTMDSELFKLRENLQHLWKVLEEDIKYCNDFSQAHTGINMSTLEAFKREVNRCEDIRKHNLKKFIDVLRKEIIDLWNEAGYTEQRREYFRDTMEDTLYTEDLLTLHDRQAEEIKYYIKKNKEIFDLLKKRDILYKRMHDLEERANAPDRYKNRGGQLLKEEKERKAVLKRIPELEAQLLDLAAKYEIANQEKFLYWGETIENLISKAREEIEQEKLLRMSARKQKRDVPTFGNRMTPRSLYTSKSPSRIHLTATQGILTPQYSSNIRTPSRTPRTAPVKKAVARRSITKAKLRYSAEKKRRINALRAMQAKPNTVTEDIDYNKFEAEVGKKENMRSTISIHSPHSNIEVPMIRVDSPHTVSRQMNLAPREIKDLF